MCIFNVQWTIDYKSIALPAELQGHILFKQSKIYILNIVSSTIFIQKINKTKIKKSHYLHLLG